MDFGKKAGESYLKLKLEGTVVLSVAEERVASRDYILKAGLNYVCLGIANCYYAAPIIGLYIFF